MAKIFWFFSLLLLVDHIFSSLIGKKRKFQALNSSSDDAKEPFPQDKRILSLKIILSEALEFLPNDITEMILNYALLNLKDFLTIPKMVQKISFSKSSHFINAGLGINFDIDNKHVYLFNYKTNQLYMVPLFLQDKSFFTTSSPLADEKYHQTVVNFEGYSNFEGFFSRYNHMLLFVKENSSGRLVYVFHDTPESERSIIMKAITYKFFKVPNEFSLSNSYESKYLLLKPTRIVLNKESSFSSCMLSVDPQKKYLFTTDYNFIQITPFTIAKDGIYEESCLFEDNNLGLFSFTRGRWSSYSYPLFCLVNTENLIDIYSICIDDEQEEVKKLVTVNIGYPLNSTLYISTPKFAFTYLNTKHYQFSLVFYNTGSLVVSYFHPQFNNKDNLVNYKIVTQLIPLDLDDTSNLFCHFRSFDDLFLIVIDSRQTQYKETVVSNLDSILPYLIVPIGNFLEDDASYTVNIIQDGRALALTQNNQIKVIQLAR